MNSPASESSMPEQRRVTLQALIVALRQSNENEIMNWPVHQLVRQSADAIEFLLAHSDELHRTALESMRDHIAHIQRVEALVARITAEVESIRSSHVHSS